MTYLSLFFLPCSTFPIIMIDVPLFEFPLNGLFNIFYLFGANIILDSLTPEERNFYPIGNFLNHLT